MKYALIVSGYNCLELAKKCVESVKKIQFNGEWIAVLCSDGSTDGTTQYITEIAKNDKRFIAQSTTENYGAAFQRHKAITENGFTDEDVMILVGLDDEVKPTCLTIIDKQYMAGAWMTYGNWEDEHGSTLQKEGFDMRFTKEVHRERSYRHDIYRSTGLNTFKYFLYKQIPKEDLQINGVWINSTTESEVMFSCLEMCGKERIGVIFEIIAKYNRFNTKRSLNRLGNKYGTNIGREHKYQILAVIKSRPKRNLYEKK
jgi:glycosyltransferase involved in cell wall biosynthesis